MPQLGKMECMLEKYIVDVNLEGTLKGDYVDRILNAILKPCDRQATVEYIKGCS